MANRLPGEVVDLCRLKGVALDEVKSFRVTDDAVVVDDFQGHRYCGSVVRLNRGWPAVSRIVAGKERRGLGS